MNRAARRANARADKQRGRGWTRPSIHRSMEQIRLQGMGERRMVALAHNLHKLPLKRNTAEVRKAA